MRMQRLTIGYLVCAIFGDANLNTEASPSPKGLSVTVQWNSGSPLPVPRAGHADGVLDGEFVVAGGTNWQADRKLWLADVYRYSVSAAAWSRGRDLPGPRAYGASFVDGGRFDVAGGTDGERNFSDVLALRSRTGLWKSNALPPFPNRAYTRQGLFSITSST